MRKLRILLTGGGTGGHIYPVIAVAQKLRAWAEKNGLEPDFRFFGDPGNYRAVLEAEKVRISRIAASKLRRYFSILNAVDVFLFCFGLLQSLAKIFFFMPDAAFSKGGPGALPVTFACRFYQVPLVVHESDAVPGLTNTISARGARALALAFSAAAMRFKKVKGSVTVVGNPVRAELLQSMPPEQAKTALGFNSAKPLVLILGGSQGAGRLNDFVLENFDSLAAKFQILHQVGKEKFKDYQAQYDFITKNSSPAAKSNYKFVAFLEKDLNAAMDAADLIVSRAGAGAIFEIAAKKKPSILIPFPDAAGDHQTQNAYEYAASGAAVVIEQENLLPSIFISQIEKIIGTPDLRNKMSAAAGDFFTPDATDKIATLILELWR